MTPESPQLTKNSRLGFEPLKPRLQQAFSPVNSNVTSGIAACLRWEGGGSRCSGKERDPESGLDYFGARYFSSAQGRFTSPDEPLVDQFEGDPQSWNLYAYTRNNPLRFFDPTGRACRVRSNGSQYDDDSGGQSCKEVEARDKQGIKPSAIVTAERGNLPTAFALNTFFALDAAASSYFRPLTNLIGIRPSYMEPIPVSQEYVGQVASLTVTAASLFVGPGGASGALRITFGHGARHLAGTGLSQKVVEAAIEADVAKTVSGASATGEFWGRVVVDGKTITYRAFTLAKDWIKIGTYTLPQR